MDLQLFKDVGGPDLTRSYLLLGELAGLRVLGSGAITTAAARSLGPGEPLAGSVPGLFLKFCRNLMLPRGSQDLDQHCHTSTLTGPRTMVNSAARN